MNFFFRPPYFRTHMTFVPVLPHTTKKCCDISSKHMLATFLGTPPALPQIFQIMTSYPVLSRRAWPIDIYGKDYRINTDCRTASRLPTKI